MPSFDPSPSNKPSPPSLPALPPGVNTFAGMDKSDYPGDRVMESLIRTTNLDWTGFYLTPAPSQGHQLGWMPKHKFLRSLGWGLAPIYVGRQEPSIPRADHRMTPENGKIDGTHAAQLAAAAGFPPRSVVYLDFENGPPLTKKATAYYVAWAEALRLGGFSPGVYCLHGLAVGLRAAVPDGLIWAVNYSKFSKKLFSSPFPQPDPDRSGVPGATMWQLIGNVFVEYVDNVTGTKQKVFVDLNSSVTKDPSVQLRRA